MTPRSALCISSSQNGFKELRARFLHSEEWEVKDTDADTHQFQRRAHRLETYMGERNWPGDESASSQIIHSTIIKTRCQVYRRSISNKLASFWWYLLSSGGRFLLEPFLAFMWFSFPSVSYQPETSCGCLDSVENTNSGILGFFPQNF